MTPSVEAECQARQARQARRALSRQTSGTIASRLTGGKRLISPNVAEAVSGLSQREISRRAEKGRFPQPVKLGEGHNGRIAYVEAEVLEWVEARIAERDRQVASAGEPEPELEAEPSRSSGARRRSG